MTIESKWTVSGVKLAGCIYLGSFIPFAWLQKSYTYVLLMLTALGLISLAVWRLIKKQ